MTLPTQWKALRSAVKDKQMLLAFFDFVFLFLPGVLIIFFFKRDLFISIDWVKLVLLSGAIMTPIHLFNSSLILSLEREENEETFFFGLTKSIWVTSIFLQIVLFITYALKLSFKDFVGIVFWVELLGTVISYETDRRRKAKEAKEQKSVSNPER